MVDLGLAMPKLALKLVLWVLVITTVVALVQRLALVSIQAKAQNTVQQRILRVLPQTYFDNTIAQNCVEVSSSLLGSRKPTRIYRAYWHQQPQALVYLSQAPEGYAGVIELMIAVLADGQVAGVQVLQHRETPGLGDNIEASKSGWLRQFSDKSLQQPLADAWQVRKDGGDFDQFTGATITPRAVVKAIKQTLEYHQHYQSELFKAKNQCQLQQ